jgi:hypothetical protein
MENKAELSWNAETGIGFCAVMPNGIYGKKYWDEYEARGRTTMGAELSAKRVELVEKYCKGQTILDIGIGAGHFISMRDRLVGPRLTAGYDVNLYAVKWLFERGLWRDPWFKCPSRLTFWDSLEHMTYPQDLVKRVGKFVFCSLPIFKDKDHALKSKHFKPGEHLWYFTRAGLVLFMGKHGLELLEENRMEEELGREDIGTFVFRRKK